MPEAIVGLLEHAAKTYLPFLAANAQALQDGTETFEVELLGRPYAQGPFRYQGKCYDALRKRFAAMPAVARDRVASVLEETGCLRYL